MSPNLCEIMSGQIGLLYPATHKEHLMCVDAFVCPRVDWGHQRVFASKLCDVNLLLSDITALHPRVREGDAPDSDLQTSTQHRIGFHRDMFYFVH